MRFLIDNSLSPLVAERLREAGHDAVHVRSYAMQAADDDSVLARAAQESRILVAADVDFATLLMLSEASGPSLILLRGRRHRRPDHQAKLLMDNLPDLAFQLTEGCVVTIDESRVRFRLLPKAHL